MEEWHHKKPPKGAQKPEDDALLDALDAIWDEGREEPSEDEAIAEVFEGPSAELQDIFEQSVGDHLVPFVQWIQNRLHGVAPAGNQRALARLLKSLKDSAESLQASGLVDWLDQSLWGLRSFTDSTLKKGTVGEIFLTNLLEMLPNLVVTHPGDPLDFALRSEASEVPALGLHFADLLTDKELELIYQAGIFDLRVLRNARAEEIAQTTGLSLDLIQALQMRLLEKPDLAPPEKQRKVPSLKLNPAANNALLWKQVSAIHQELCRLHNRAPHRSENLEEKYEHWATRLELLQVENEKLRFTEQRIREEAEITDGELESLTSALGAHEREVRRLSGSLCQLLHEAEKLLSRENDGKNKIAINGN